VTLNGNVTGYGSLWGKSLSANGSVVWNRVKDPMTPSVTITQPTDGSTIANDQPAITISYSNDGAMTGLNLQSLAMNLDGASIVSALTVTATGATGTAPSALSNGSHTLTATISDYDGNTAQTTVSFTVEK